VREIGGSRDHTVTEGDIASSPAICWTDGNQMAPLTQFKRKIILQFNDLQTVRWRHDSGTRRLSTPKFKLGHYREGPSGPDQPFSAVISDSPTVGASVCLRMTWSISPLARLPA